jgi:hypothetical protein
MTQMNNTAEFVREVVWTLSEAGFQVAVLGGWGDEPLGAAPLNGGRRRLSTAG